MPDLDLQGHTAPRILSFVGAAPSRRPPRGTGTGAAAVSPVEQLVRTMFTVKAARFNAAERLERKHLVSVVALSVVSLYFVGLSVWQAVYATSLSEPANKLITLVSIMSSVCTLVLALIEAMNDYKIKAHHMHACALEVNDLLQELRLIERPDAAVVQEFRRRYNAVVRGCPVNHARIDFLMVRTGSRWDRKIAVYLRYAAGVYGLYALCLAGPPLLLLLFY
jgi:hypothetical protein